MARAMMRKGCVPLLLLLWLLSGPAEACQRDVCSLNRVRGCGSCPVNPDFVGEAEVSPTGVKYKCYVGPSVVAATLTDIRRLPSSYIMLLEMPGVGISGVKVEISGSLLSVSGLLQELPADRYHWERGAYTKLFARKFLLPPHVDAEGISYKLEHGLLRVTLPILRGASFSSIDTGVEPAKLPVAGPRLPPLGCRAEDADRVVRPQPLLGFNKPGSCAEDSMCVISISSLTDMIRWDESKPELEVVVEMPGVETAQVEVDCRQGTLPSDFLFEFRKELKRGTPGCIVSVRGVYEEADEGELVRVERGEAKRKEFVRSLYFRPPGVVADNSTYYVTDGLLRFQLRELPVPVSGIWASVVGSAWKVLGF